MNVLEQLKTIVTEREEEKEMVADLWKDGQMKVDIKGGRNRLFSDPWI